METTRSDVRLTVKTNGLSGKNESYSKTIYTAHHSRFAGYTQTKTKNIYYYAATEKMKSNIEQPWLEAGYQLFSKDGPAGLKIDQLARAVGISRSSFYHLFADLAVFEEKLLLHHAERARGAAVKVKNCKVMEPDFILVVLEEKDYVLFNRQLRIYRDNPVYKAGFEGAIAVVGGELMGLWTEMLDLQHQPEVARNIFKMTSDIFFHRLTEENMNYEWLNEFLKEIKLFIKEVNTKAATPNEPK